MAYLDATCNAVFEVDANTIYGDLLRHGLNLALPAAGRGRNCPRIGKGGKRHERCTQQIGANSNHLVWGACAGHPACTIDQHAQRHTGKTVDSSRARSGATKIRKQMVGAVSNSAQVSTPDRRGHWKRGTGRRSSFAARSSTGTAARTQQRHISDASALVETRAHMYRPCPLQGEPHMVNAHLT